VTLHEPHGIACRSSLIQAHLGPLHGILTPTRTTTGGMAAMQPIRTHPRSHSVPFDSSRSLEHLEQELTPHYTGPNLPANIESISPKVSVAAPESSFTKQAHLHGYLTIFSILGTLARLGLTALCNYEGAPVGGSVIWANFVGATVMGYLVDEAAVFGAGKATLPLYTGLTTGFCGSLTSFSSFEYDAFLYLANIPESKRASRGYNFLAVVAYIIATLCMSLGGLQFGAHVAVAARHARLPPLPISWLRALDAAIVPLAAACWAAAVVMAVLIPRWRGVVLFACVFSPLGVYARFWVSRRLNPLVKAFPLGTFTCNLAGSLLLPGLHIAMATHRGIPCQVAKGIGDGFCGCLTTVSTFVVEVRGLRTLAAYVYGGTTVAAGLAAMVVVLGSWTWSQGGLVEFC
jgi:CrcB protein